MEKIWYHAYDKGIPHTINVESETSLISLFLKAVKRYPNHVAISNMGTTITYKALDALSKQFANYLRYELKLQKGDRVASMLPNILQMPVVMLGVLRAGLVMVNVNPLYTPRELIHQLNDSGAKGLVALENFAHVVEQALPHINLTKVVITSLGDAFPTLKRHLVNFVVRKVKKMVPAFKLPDAIDYLTAMASGGKHQYHAMDITLADTAFLQYTGGTTGVAKGAQLLHRNMVANVLQTVAWVRPCATEGEEIMVVALPLYHIFSLTVCFFCFLDFGSHCLLVTNPRDMDGFIKILTKQRFTFFAGVNTLFNALISHKNINKVNFSNLKLTVSGGMALQSTIAKKWHKLTGLPIVEGYGLTEASPVVTINPCSIKEFNHSIGVPIPSTDVKIIDDQGETITIAGEGELCVKGPQVMKGYWNHPEATKEVLDEQGWLKTGDIAHIDENGFLYIVDRKKDMIVVSGFNVYPNEIEDVISSLEGVALVAVIGVPNQKTTETVKAFVIRSNPKLTEADVIAYCRKNLTPYKVPKQIEFRYELPLSNVGKVLRRELRDQQ